MKNSKFWIWFLPLFVILCVGMYFLLNISKNMSNNDVSKSDSEIFKEEYEQYNNSLIEVSLSDNNSYTYAKEDGIKELFNNGSGVLFLGNAKNNVSRNIVEVLNDVIMSTSVPKIFYYDIESIKPEFKVENNSLVNIKSNDFYNFLVNKLSSYINDNIEVKDNNTSYNTEVINIKSGIVISFNKGEIVDFYYPDWLENKNEKINQEEKERLQKRYLEGISKIVEECDSSC